MSNITRNYIVPAGLPYKVGVRSWGKEDLVRTLYGSVEEATISRDEMQNYVLDGITVTPVINDSKAVIDFSNVKLPWKFEHSDKLLTSRFAIAPLGTTVTQPKYVKELNATIVGSPTVTEDFIVKGFTSSSKLRVSNQGAYTDNVKFYFKLSFGSDISSTQEFMWNYTGNNFGIGSNSNSWRIWIGSGVTGTSIKSNTTYWVCVNQDGSGTKLYTIEDNGTYSKENLPKDLSQWILSASTSTTVFGNNDYCYGGSTVTTGEYWRSSIDMNNCWIEIDGVEVWSGTHWVDRVLNTNKIGNLTIDRDYVASGFSSNTSYAQIPVLLDFSKPWEMVIKHYYTGNGIQCFLTSPSTGSDEIPGFFQNGFSGWIDTSNIINFRFSHDGVNGNTINAGRISVNNSYYIRGRWDGTTYYAGYSTDGVNYTEVSYESTMPLFNPTKLSTIGVHICTSSWNLRGTVDLKECYFKSGNEYLWRGVEDFGTETLSGCVRYYYGEGEHVTTPPRDSTQYYNIYAVNGDEGVVLDSTYFHEGTMVYNRPIVTGGEIPQFENEWYLGEYRVETGEEGYIFVPIPLPNDNYFNPGTGGGIVLT